MISLPVKEKVIILELYINEVGLGTAFGVLMGPKGVNAVDPRSWGTATNTITLEVLRIVLATSLFAIGVELPQAYMAKHAKSLIVMVVPTMAIGWVIVAGVIHVLFPPLTFPASLAIAACLTPTDPVICATIVAGKYAKTHVPEKLRHILSAESAANDGMAYPFLTISLYLILDSSWRAAIKDWVLIGCLYQVLMGTTIGAMLGIIFCHLMKYLYKRGFIDRESYITQYISLALLVTGIVCTIGSDDLLAAFAAGCAISWDGDFKIHVEGDSFWSIIDLVLNSACFVYLGAWLQFQSFNNPALGIVPWRLVVLLVVILFLRRIPALLMLYKWIPEIDTWQEALFSGHFGDPNNSAMGVSAIFVSCLALQKLPTGSPQQPPENATELLAATLQPIVSFVVLGSIIIHGLSPPFFSLLKLVHSKTLSLHYTDRLVIYPSHRGSG
ncbi:Sodium/hydrogen exchanger [Tricholoma matsutake]|nr:Sodium/hydrogen exchanger [Tricholoma matsutake 945]